MTSRGFSWIRQVKREVYMGYFSLAAQPGVNLLYDFHSATIIEIALSNVAVHGRPTVAIQKAAKKVGEQRTRSTFTIKKTTLG